MEARLVEIDTKQNDVFLLIQAKLSFKNCIHVGHKLNFT